LSFRGDGDDGLKKTTLGKEMLSVAMCDAGEDTSE